MRKKTKIIPIFIPHQGCPNDCIFCNQKKITGKGKHLDVYEIENDIKEFFSTIDVENYEVEIAFFGGSFTAIDIELQRSLLKIAYDYKSRKLVNRIRLSTRPDAIDYEILDILEDNGVDIIELGVQSLNDDVLLKINRGHTAEDTLRASSLIKERGFILGHQIMPGVYGSSPLNDIETAEKSIEMNPDIVRIYPALTIRDTKMEELYNDGSYNPPSLLKSIDVVAYIYSLYEVAGIKIIRVGLQATENINYDGDIVGGPFHPAYRQLVLTHIMTSSLVWMLKDCELDELTVACSKTMINSFAGINGRGKKDLIEKLDLVSVKFKEYHKENTVLLKFNDMEVVVETKKFFDYFIKTNKESGYVFEGDNY
ncbi:Radical_SAM C-terminal domain-containing protein [Dethiosulfatibacter aminovorans DSM 17477]|uniref:Radical_SAM C-terminal domain-containing protein n=1 Tax=Dethiosulfatibacter aminovorans DSM 17477 TaxID=1121476 RepID=A0A1M6DGP7_9FIRM|nr:radical SAM protein [Dethiosulfatibacter aminovorans]SHI72350.1 Radical_SAM C-terminal domain-containing protein [Dethiosulfatibacter aminovorans DSM 17477]